MPMDEGRPALPPAAGGGRPMNMPMPMPIRVRRGTAKPGCTAGETPMAMPMPMGPRSSAATAGGEGTPALGVPGTPLSDLEAMALRHNPTLVQAQAQVEASMSKSFQAGLMPNPIAGYVSEQMGAGGGPGETQGGFVEQEIMRGGKLRLSRAKYRQEAVQAEMQVDGPADADRQRRPDEVLRRPGRPASSSRSSGELLQNHEETASAPPARWQRRPGQPAGRPPGPGLGPAPADHLADRREPAAEELAGPGGHGGRAPSRVLARRRRHRAGHARRSISRRPWSGSSSTAPSSRSPAPRSCGTRSPCSASASSRSPTRSSGSRPATTGRST